MCNIHTGNQGKKGLIYITDLSAAWTNSTANPNCNLESLKECSEVIGKDRTEIQLAYFTRIFKRQPSLSANGKALWNKYHHFSFTRRYKDFIGESNPPIMDTQWEIHSWQWHKILGTQLLWQKLYERELTGIPRSS